MDMVDGNERERIRMVMISLGATEVLDRRPRIREATSMSEAQRPLRASEKYVSEKSTKPAKQMRGMKTESEKKVPLKKKTSF